MEGLLTIPSIDVIEWHLANNFYPPYNPKLATACQSAIKAVKEGTPDLIIPIEGHTEIDGEPLTAQKIINDFYLFLID